MGAGANYLFKPPGEDAQMREHHIPLKGKRVIGCIHFCATSFNSGTAQGWAADKKESKGFNKAVVAAAARCYY